MGSFQKILTRLRGTNFRTNSARFASRSVGQPNCPKCTQIVQNAQKRQFRVQWGGSCPFVAKYSNATSHHELSVLFAPSFVRHPNGTECTQIVRKTTKRQLRVQWGGSGAFVAKNSDATSHHELSVLFAPSFVRHPNGPECTQIVRNTLKHQFRVQWDGSGAFIVKNSDTTSWHKLLH